MNNRYLIPIAIILMLVLAACSGSTAPEVSQAEIAGEAETAGESQDGSMDDDGHQDDMMEESQDKDMDNMDDDGHQDGMDEDDMDDDGHQEDMDDDGHQEDMDDDGHEDGMDDDGHEDDMDEDDMEDDGHQDGMDEDDMSASMLPVWQTIALANAATGEAFTLGDFQGKTVFVEPMATWCGNCRSQQGHVREAKAQLGDDVVFIGLSLETNLPAGDLANYAQGNGFDWTYAVMPVELLAQLTDQFGRSITSAPSTPHFLIRPDGSFTDLATGIHPADAIIAEIQAEQG